MMDDNFDFSGLCGWRGIDATQRNFAMQFPALADAAPHLMADASPTDPILLYKAWRQVLGKDPDYVAQQIGDCTSFGHAHANDLLQCVEISMGEPAVFSETDTEFIYGEGRKVAGILGGQDGGYGSACVKAMTTVGMVSRVMLGTDGAYSGKRAKAWGRTGPPADVEAKAAAFKLGAAANVTTWSELVAAMQNGFPVTICTGQGFVLTRDAQGFCSPHGTWGHCMSLCGLRFDRPGACVLQSWGPNMPTGPLGLDQPNFSFWVDQSTIERILAEGDSWAISKSPEFVKRDLPPSWKYSDAA